MAVIIQVGQSTATVKNREWTSKDKELLRRLVGLLARYTSTGADPWPDWTIANQAVDELGGKVIGQTDPPKTVPGRIY
jgi:hypothetical protein